MKSSLALAALVAATVGLAALPAVAQTATAAPVAAHATDQGRGDMRPARPLRNGDMRPMRNRDGGGAASILDLACSTKGAEALEIALVRLGHRFDLTDDQQKLFDDFRTKALTTQTSFADSCTAAKPDKTATAAPDLLTRLKSRLAIDSARITALNTVLPTFEAFYNSLSDEQKAELTPHGKGGTGGQTDNRGTMGRQHDDRGTVGRTARPPAPGR
jgi:hypothetical protein